MKTLIASLLLIPSLVWAYQRPTYIMTPRGPMRVITPQEYKRQQAEEKNKLEGVGMEYGTKAEIKDGKVSVWVRGCNKMELGSQEVGEDASDTEKAQAQKLKTLKNGDSIMVKMEAYGKCSVKDWRKQ